MTKIDSILVPSSDRFTVFPIVHEDLWKAYKEAQSLYWSAEEMDLSADLNDWNNKLTDNERYYIKHILAFFASSDGIVSENLVERFYSEIQYAEAKCFLAFQLSIETVHGEVYSLLIDTYIKDREEKLRLFQGNDTIPCIKKKADWALKWIASPSASFASRLVAFACVEGIFFSSAFASIFWLRSRGLLPGLSFANDLIARDEAQHCQFAALVYRSHVDYGKLTTEEVHAIVKEATDIEIEFQRDAFPCSLIGINVDSMTEYVKYTADYLLGLLQVEPIYDAKQPFSFMETISLRSVTNFFEKRVSEYAKPMGSREFAIDADF